MILKSYFSKAGEGLNDNGVNVDNKFYAKIHIIETLLFVTLILNTVVIIFEMSSHIFLDMSSMDEWHLPMLLFCGITIVLVGIPVLRYYKKLMRRNTDAIRELEESVNFNTSLIKAIPFGIDVIDGEGNVVYISDSLKSLAGKDAGEKKCWTLFRNDGQQCVNCFLKRDIWDDGVQTVEREDTLGGRTFRISHAGIVFRGRRAVLEVFNDITVYKRMEEELNKALLVSEAVIESTADGILVVDTGTSILSYNKKFMQMWNFPEEMARKYNDIRALVSNVDGLSEPVQFMDRVRELFDDLDAERQGTINFTDGRVFEFHTKPLRIDGKAVGRVLSFRDISVQKRTGERMSRINDCLLNFTADSNGNIQRLTNLCSELLDGVFAVYTSFDGGVLYTAGMLDGLEDTTSINKLIGQICSDKVLKNGQDGFLIKDFEHFIDGQSILGEDRPGFATVLGKAVRCDRQYIGALCILNTRDFTPDDGDTRLIGIIADVIGLEEKRRPLDILESTRRKTEIAAVLESGLTVEMDKTSYMDCVEEENRIMPESNGLSTGIVPGRDSYCIEPKKADAQDTLSDANVNILLVEDNFINQKLACTLLEKAGWKVTTVSDGMSALAVIDKSSFDLVLMDIQMPGMDGLETTREIRQREKTAGGHIPIIGMTAYAMKEDRERCIENGMDDHISKPIVVEELYSVVKRYLAGRPEKQEESLNNNPVDLTFLSSVSQGEDGLVEELVNILLETYPGELEQIKQAILSVDFIKLERKAHSFRGSLLNYRADKACAICLQLEEMGRNKRTEGSEIFLKELQEEMERIRVFLSDREPCSSDRIGD